MKRILGLVVVVGLAGVMSGCDDDVGATQGDVDTSLGAHAGDASAHHTKTTDAAELTTGVLDAARVDPSLTGAVATNTTDIATNTADVATNAGNITTNAGDIATSAGDIATNAGDIATNAGDIATNAGDIGTNAADIATNAGDILDRVEAGGDTMTGNLTVPDVVFTNPKTKYVSVQALAFVGDATTTFDTALTGNGLRAMSGGTLRAGAPVDLPHGAVITDMTVRLIDNSATDNVVVQLPRPAPGPPIVATADSGIAATGVSSASAGALSHTVDLNGIEGYFLRWDQSTASAGFSPLAMWQVRITYTYDSP